MVCPVQLSRRDTAVRAVAAPVRLPSCCPLPNNARCPMLCYANASECRPACAALVFTQALLRRPEHPTWYTSRRPLDYTFWLLFSPLSLANHVPEPHYCVVHASLGLRTSSPNVLSLPRASPTTIMLVAAHLGSIPRPGHDSFSSLLPLTPRQASDASHHSSTG